MKLKFQLTSLLFLLSWFLLPHFAYSETCQETLNPLITRGQTEWMVWDPEVSPVRVQMIIDQSITDTERLIMGRARLSKGETLPLHRHEETEIYRITKGKGLMILGEQEHMVGAGDVIFIPSHVQHQITGASNIDLEFEFTFEGSRLHDIEYIFIVGETNPGFGD